jgi:phage gpG-like protein
MEIIVDSTATRAYFSKLMGRLKDMRTPNRRASRILANLVYETFDSQKAPWGTKWRKLRPSTQRWRRRSGYAPGPTLRASGWLRASIKPQSGRADFRIEATASYADVHQEGNPANLMYGRGRAPIPARPYMPIQRGRVRMPQPWWDAVLAPYNNLVNEL